MAAKGTIAKEKIVKKLAEVFGQDWIGEYDKKYYLWADDGGERVQIAISMTCPKNPVGEVAASAFSNALDFNEMPSAPVAPSTFEPAEITEEEQANIQELMRKLGL